MNWRRLFHPQKKRSRKKKRRGSPVTPLTWALTGAVVLLIAGIGFLKWVQTGTGQATLLTLGRDQSFGDVQDRIETVLVEQFPGFRPGATAAVSTGPGVDYDWPVPGMDSRAAVRCRSLLVKGDRPYEQIQLTLQRALQQVGGRILWAERLPVSRPKRARGKKHPDLLRLDLGVKGKPTHTLVLYRQQNAPPVVWGNQGGVSAWDLLQQKAQGPVIALVIDDWGNSRNQVTAGLLELPVPLTMAVLPNLPYSRHFALEASDLILPTEESQPGVPARGQDGPRRRRQAGVFVQLKLGQNQKTTMNTRRREVILHCPMEPQGYPETNPGAKPVLVGMSQQEIAEILDGALKNLPPVRGLNNHMGSAATSDQVTMDNLMAVLHRRGLFFIDSLTTSRSVAYATALDKGVPSLRNRIFLDYNNKSEETIAANLQVLVRSARERGLALGIGHPHPATLRVLQRELPRLLEQGVCFVTVSEMLALMAARQAGGQS